MFRIIDFFQMLVQRKNYHMEMIPQPNPPPMWRCPATRSKQLHGAQRKRRSLLRTWGFVTSENPGLVVN